MKQSFKKFTKIEARIIRNIRAFLKTEGLPAGKPKRNTLLIDLAGGNWHRVLRMQHHIAAIYKIDFHDDEKKPRRLCIQGMRSITDMARAIMDVNCRKDRNGHQSDNLQ
jgi:hypothetical protein